MMIRLCVGLLIAAFAWSLAGPPLNACASEPASKDDITGRWHNRNGAFEIYTDNGKLNARIVSLREPLAPDGQVKTDIHNPDPSKHRRPIIGMVFMTGFTPAGPGRWDHGTIYDPQSGKTYSCTMELQDTDTLKVHGYVLVSAIGRTEIWTRGDL
jgi:uncharacterized protein (DUF2147 family)